jgi:hypothetical protein
MLKKLMAFGFIVALIASFTIKDASATELFQAEKFPYQEMQVQVMPEFDYPKDWSNDKPALLVGYFGTFVNKSGSDYSGEITFPLPVDDPDFEMYLAAEFPEDDKPEVQVEYKIDKEQKLIIWKPTKPIKKDATYDYVIEYYANPIKVKDTKSFNFSFTPPADMKQVNIVFYAPINSKDFTVDPKAINESKSEYGEEIHHYQYQNVKKGELVSYKASYVKEDNTSSMSVISTMAPPKDENHQGTSATTATEQVLNNSGGANKVTNRPLIDTTGAVIIGISMVIMGLFVFIGLKGRKSSPPSKTLISKKTNKGSNITKKIDTKTDEKKVLRSMFMSGEIDQQTYEERIKKLG